MAAASQLRTRTDTQVADVFVVNKADRDGADTVVRDLRYMLSLGDRRTDEGWRVPIVKTVASRGEGADEVVEQIERHGGWLVDNGQLEVRRRHRAADEVEAIALTILRERIGDLSGSESLALLAGRVVSGELDPYTAADELVSGLTA